MRQRPPPNQIPSLEMKLTSETVNQLLALRSRPSRVTSRNSIISLQKSCCEVWQRQIVSHFRVEIDQSVPRLPTVRNHGMHEPESIIGCGRIFVRGPTPTFRRRMQLRDERTAQRLQLFGREIMLFMLVTRAIGHPECTPKDDPLQ